MTIANASPVILGASATGTLRPIGSSIDAAVVFSDADVQDTHTVAWSWGDGSTTTGPSAASHVYTAPGVYRVEVTVNDDDGGSTTTEAGTVVIMTPARDR